MKFPALAAAILATTSLNLLAQKPSSSPTTTAFTGTAPRLVEVRTTFKSVRARHAKYYFTVALPPELQQPLGQIDIQQQTNLETIEYRLEETIAFPGTFNDRGESLPLKSVTLSPDHHTVSINFDPPVAPGTTISVRLKPKENPSYDGIYLFRVTTFPAGPNPQGMSLGVGRLHFYRPSF